MWKFSKMEAAKLQADATGKFFGMSVFDGKFYVGTREQLDKIGCINITAGVAGCDHAKLIGDNPGLDLLCPVCGYVYAVEGGA